MEGEIYKETDERWKDIGMNEQIGERLDGWRKKLNKVQDSALRLCKI